MWLTEQLMSHEIEDIDSIEVIRKQCWIDFEDLETRTFDDVKFEKLLRENNLEKPENHLVKGA